MSVTIFTDGSSRGNPGPGGWGAIIIDQESVQEIGGANPGTTNNRMELTAVIESLKRVEGNIKLFTDSEYIVKGITTWVSGWQKNNWRTAARKPVLNQDLWQELIEVVKNKNITWSVVKGHSGIHLNERCDEIATSFSDGVNANLYNGSKDHYSVSLGVYEKFL